jgi:hypothetical protein
VFRDIECALPRTSRFKLWLKFRDSISRRVLEFLVRIKARGVSRRIECIRTMYESSTEGYRGRVFDLEEEVRGRRENAVVRGRIGYGVADYFSDFEAADLVKEEHGRIGGGEDFGEAGCCWGGEVLCGCCHKVILDIGR